MGLRITSVVGGARVVCGAASLLGLARLGWAGPLDTAVVDKDATWMFHLDVEAGMASACGKYVTEQMSKDPKANEVTVKFGLDPARDIKSMTVYGFKPGEDDGVAVLVTTASIDALPKKLETEKAEGLETQVLGDVTRLSWKSDGRDWHVAIKPRGAERLAVFTSSSQVLDTGLSVLTGGKPSLSTMEPGGVAPMLQKPAKGSVLFVTARGLETCPKFKAAFFKEARSLVIDVGEEAAKSGEGRETFAMIAITTADEQMATSMQQMVQGLIGMGSMLARNNDVKGVPESLQGIKVATEGSSLVISAREDSNELLQQLRSLGAAVKATADGQMGLTISTANQGGPKQEPAGKGSAPKEPGTK